MLTNMSSYVLLFYPFLHALLFIVVSKYGRLMSSARNVRLVCHWSLCIHSWWLWILPRRLKTVSTARRSYVSAVLGSLFCPTVCLFVCPTVTRVLCDKTKQCTADILIPHERAITLLLGHQQWLWETLPSLWNLHKWPTPFDKRRLQQISAYNVSTVRGSEKSSIMTNRKSITGFSTSNRWSAYVTPKSPKGWLTKRFFVFEK